MPIENPPIVPAALISALASYTWSANHLVDANGGAHWLVVDGSNPGTWAIGATGVSAYHFAESTFTSLKNGSADTDGSYTDAGGSVWWLRRNADHLAYPSAT